MSIHKDMLLKSLGSAVSNCAFKRLMHSFDDVKLREEDLASSSECTFAMTS